MERFNIELKKRDCSGIYAVTQRLMTYNSNKIAGSTLTEERIAFLFDTGSLPPSDHDYRAKDIKRMEETLDNGLYPVTVMLQILGYPDYDLEEYRLHFRKFIKQIRVWQHINLPFRSSRILPV